MRFFLECSFDGTPFHGWQKQPGHSTVQETIEKSLQTLLREQKLELVGCGRTDTGVHAENYIAHFDFDFDLKPDLVYHLNAVLPPEIAIHTIRQVRSDAHARYDAFARTYKYYLHGVKSPFLIHKSFFYKKMEQLNISDLQQAAQLLMNYSSFYPFCLSNSGVKNYAVNFKSLEWSGTDSNHMVFTIKANRFLRGMVRLVVGMCLQVASGQLTLGAVQESLEQQTLLPKSLSVPPHGLFLTHIEYPETGIFI